MGHLHEDELCTALIVNFNLLTMTREHHTLNVLTICFKLKQNENLMHQLPHSLGSHLKTPVVLIGSIINQALKNGLFLDLLFMTIT